MRAIATELGRSPSTISRELRRNVPPLTTQYRPYRADQLAKARQTRPKTPKILLTPQLLERVSQKLAQHWSPEQISAWLHREFADNENMHLCPETIYQAIYVQAKGQLKLEVKTALRTGRVRRKSHALDQQRIGRFREPMTMISDRPAGVEDRAVPGRWKGGLILGQNNKTAIGTLVERSARFIILLKLEHDHTSLAVQQVIVAKMGSSS